MSSVSKLESLPNEILVSLFEKYVNGVDIINAFAFQLNRRFDALIGQCQRLRFDFMQCRKNDFSLCMGLLPAYIDRIEELSLSDDKAPGQIYAFLTFFPSFDAFTQLRRLYLHATGETCAWGLIEGALLSLCDTNINILALKATSVPDRYSIKSCLADIITAKTLKKLVVSSNSPDRGWDLLQDVSANVEQFILTDESFSFSDFEKILPAMPNLKYFKARVQRSGFRGFRNVKPGMKCTLHTLVLNLEKTGSVRVETLQEVFKLMPDLRYLKITSIAGLFDAATWEILLTTSLPSLKHFELCITVLLGTAEDNLRLLNSFETPFWTEKNDFTITITEFGTGDPDYRYRQHRRYLDKNSTCLPVAQFWTGPTRSGSPARSPITNIFVSDASKLRWEHHYFTQVHRLFIHTTDHESLNWIPTNINCSEIYYLEVSPSSIPTRSLLPALRNVRYIRASLDHICTKEESNSQAIPSVRYLNLADSEHSFNEEEVTMIATRFPNLEHLIILTKQLSNVPLLQQALPGLRSLTHYIIDRAFPPLNSVRELSLWEAALRRRTKLFFHRQEQYLTIWLDNTADNRSYWNSPNTDRLALRDEESFSSTYNDGFSFFD